MTASRHWFIYAGSITCPHCGEEPISAQRESRRRWVLGWLMTGDRSRTTSNVCANGHDWENGRSAIHPPRTRVGRYLHAAPDERNNRRNLEYQLRADALGRIDMVGMTEEEIVREMEGRRRDIRSAPTPKWRTVSVTFGTTDMPAKRVLMGVAEATSIPVTDGFVTTLCRHTSLDDHALELVDATDYKPAF